MTEEQVRLLHKLQMAGIPAFANINPLTLSSDEASDFFRMNLPPLEWLDASAVTEDHEFEEKRFIGVSENNCREQMQKWLDKENLTLLQQPNPQFGSGEIWLAYFSQPMESVNFKALEDHFKRWEINAPNISIPKDQQEIIGSKPSVPPQEIYQRLSQEETLNELENLASGKGISDGIQLGVSPEDVHVLAENGIFHTFLSPLNELTAEELQAPPDDIAGQIKIGEAFSDVDAKPYYQRLTPEEVQSEIEYFQERGHFRSDIDIGFNSGVKSDGKSMKPFVEELSSEQLDQLEAGKFPHPRLLTGQKLLGYTTPQLVGIYRRLTSDELVNELKTYAETNKFSSGEIQVGRIPDRETHKKEFPAPLTTLSEQDIKALSEGRTIQNQEILQAQKFVCRTPEIPGSLIYEKKFSSLELAFDDCPEERLEIYTQHRKDTDEKAFNKITPEQRAMIKALQAAGKAPKIERNDYLAFNRQTADAYIKENENNPENTFAATIYPTRSASKKEEAFPDIKKSNLIYHKKADYLLRSILRDLIAEGHVATPETKQELLDKLEFIVDFQAVKLITPHVDKPAGAGLLDQCKAYIENGKIHNTHEIKTIIDVHRLFINNRNLNFDMKAALRDLIEAGYIQSDDALAKIQFTTKEQDQALISKYGDAPIGNNLKNRIFALIDDARIGGMEDEQFKKLTIRSSMEIIASNTEMENFRNPTLATAKQKELLNKMAERGIVDLKKIDMKYITLQAANYLIEENIAKMYPPKPATPSQKGLLKILIVNKLSDPIPYDKWQALTMTEVSERISKVPEGKRNELFEKLAREKTDKTPVKALAPER